jgi:hypothetical protein
VDVVLDSTGLKVFGEGEWKVRQHGPGKPGELQSHELSICNPMAGFQAM